MNSRNLVLLIMLALFLVGCIGTPTRPANFYLLQPDPGHPVASRISATEPLSVGLGPISMPEVYDRPQIVTRSDNNQINLAEFDRWAGDLNKELSRTLAQNLMGRLNTDRISLYPWSSRHKPDFQVSIQLFRMDGQLDHATNLDGVWRLFDGSKSCELAVHRFQITEPANGPGYPALVDAISRAVAHLSQEIAEHVATAETGC